MNEATDLIHVHVYSLAFPALQRDIQIQPGPTLHAMIRDMGFPMDFTDNIKVALHGVPIPPEQWPNVKPEGGKCIHIGVIPAGDDTGPDKGQLRQIASIATVLGGALIPNALGLSGVANVLLRSAITGGGVWAATTFIPVPEKDDNQSFQLSTTRNQARPYGPIPKPYGRMRIYPTLAAQPITRVAGNDQYISLLLVAGFKPLHVDVSTMKIGETPITEFFGVRRQVDDGFTNHARITTFGEDVEETFMDRRVGFAENWQASGSNSDGVVSITTPVNTRKISMDFTFPDGLGRRSGETLYDDSVELEIQYRPAGTETWINHVYDPDDYVYNLQAEGADRAQVIQWMADLGALLSDNLDVVELLGDPWLAVGGDLLESLKMAQRTLYNPLSYYVSLPNLFEELEGETSAFGLLFECAQRLQRIIDAVQDAVSSGAPGTPAFTAAITNLIVPSLAAGYATLIRRQMLDTDNFPGNGANVEGLRDLYEDDQISHIFQTLPQQAVIFVDQRAGVVRRNVSIDVPAGKWEVRLRKLSADHDDDSYLDECRLSVFRSYRDQLAISPAMREKLALIYVDVKATDQLTGGLDQISVEVETPLRYTEDGETWQGPALRDGSGNNVSRNPAWAMADLLTQTPNQNAVTLDKLDGDSLLAFGTWCTENNYHFDHVFDQNSTVHRCLQDVCRVAKASPAMRDGRYAVVHDVPQTVPRGVITLSNASNFEAGKTMQKRPQALRIRFVNPAKDWADDEIHVYDDGFGEGGKIEYRNEVARAESATLLKCSTLFEDVSRIYDVAAQSYLDIDDYTVSTNTAGTKTTIIPKSSPTDDFAEGGNYNVIGNVQVVTPTRVEEVNIPGLVDVPQDPNHAYYSGQVYKLGRYLLAAAKLRPETFKATVDFEHLTYERGDLVEAQMDTVLWGLGSSRIKSLTRVSGGGDDGKVESITLEQDLALTDAEHYACRIRNMTNTFSSEAAFDYDVSEPDTITFETPFNDSTTNLRKGDLVSWGEPSKASISCLVQEIKSRRDLGAEVTLIQYSPGVYEAENGAIPPYDPRITIPPIPELPKPPAPAIVKVTTDESVLERDTDGSFASRIVLDLRNPEGRTRAERDAASRVDAVQVQFRPSTPDSIAKAEWVRSGTYAGDVTRVSIRDVQDRQSYDVRARSITKDGTPSDWATRLNVTVIGKTSPPPNVTNLRWVGGRLSWEYPDPPADHLGFVIRYYNGVGGSWKDARLVPNGFVRTNEYYAEPAFEGTRSYFIKAVDTTKNLSRDAAVVTRTSSLFSNALYEHTRVTNETFGSGWTKTGEVWSVDALAGSQEDQPFYKGRAGSAFYRGSSEPFYQTTYPEISETIESGAVASNPTKDTGRWVPDVVIDESAPFVIEAKNEGTELWPEDMDAPLWPEDMSEPLWPEYMDFQPVGQEGVPDTEGREVSMRLTAFAGNDQLKLTKFDMALVIPTETEELFNVELPYPGNPVVSLGSGFLTLTGVQITIVADDDYPDAAYARSGKASGSAVTILIYDKDGNRTGGIVDVVVTGY